MAGAISFSRIKYWFFLVIGCAVISINLGYSSGYSVGSGSGCGCHGPSSSATSIIVSGLPNGSVSYVPGNVYPITVTVTNPTINAAGVAVSVGIGTLQNLGSGLILDGPQSLTHSSPKLSNGAPYVNFSFDWQAPSVANQAIDFEVSASAVNLDGTTSGDEWNSGVLFLPLHVALNSFDLSATANQVLLTWKSTSEQDIAKYVVERSLDGIEFDSIGVVVATGDANTGRAYSYTDNPKYTDVYYYRLKLLAKSNSPSALSLVKSIKFDNGAPFDAVLFPNPIQLNGDFNVNVFNCKSSNVRVEVQDVRGKTMYNKLFSTTNGTNYLRCNCVLGGGTYVLRITDANGRTILKKLTMR